MSYTKTNWQNLPSTDTPVIANSLNNIENGVADANGAIAVNTYSSSSTYAVGDYCIYNNKLYKCTTAISTAEAFNSTKWQQIKIAEEINNTGVTVSSTEPTGNNKNKVWFKKGKNLFNAYEYSFSTRNANEVYKINNSNKLTVSGTSINWTRAKTTIYSLKPNTTYTLSSNITNSSQHNVAIIVTVGETEVSATTSQASTRISATFTTDSTGRIEVLFMSNWSSTALTETVVFDNIMLEENSNASNYENYIFSNIYVKNSNDSYEKFKNDGIVSSGENEDGNYIQFSDGTLICYAKKSFNVNFETDNSRYNIENAFKFPLTFSTNPVVNINAFNDSDYTYAMIYGVIRNYAGISSISLYRLNSGSGSITLGYIAIGKWN